MSVFYKLSMFYDGSGDLQSINALLIFEFVVLNK